ncbi:Tat pathway signal protein [Anaerotardibacter muris]|uniref:Tat pathway signal protein n=1 Tax=Anaerotardibacter muris TaxID=2941505 RepID=UPI0020412748|nr:Tat pathway signal protein [Anaerotardibacter muris]
MPQKRTPKSPAQKPSPTKRKGKVGKSAHTHEGASSFSRVRAVGTKRRKPLGSHGRLDGSSRTRSAGAGASTGSGASTNGAGPFSPEVLLTRRNLLIGAGAVGGLAAVGGISSAVSSAFSETESIKTLSVPQDAVSELADFNEVPFGDYVKLSISQRLPFGSLVWADNNTVAACLCPTEEAHPLNTIRLFYFGSANLVEVLKKPHGFDDGFDIYDVRCSTDGVIWTECNIYEDTWRIYTAQLGNAQLSNIQMVDEGDGNWQTPSIAACKNAAFWQVIPNSEGEAAKEKAVLRAARFGEANYQEVCESLRTFACRIVAVEDGVVAAPRLNTSTPYYQLTKFSAEDFSVVDQLTLPQRMTPCNLGYGRSGFAFAFDNIYNYGEGISNLGTYTPMHAVDPYHYEDLPWFRFGRTPSATPTWCEDWFVVKSSRAICGVHFASKNFFMIDIPNDTDTYGEYLVSAGSCKNIVGLSQITSTTEGENDYTLLRVFAPTSKSLGDPFAN